ncbi:MAG: NAD-dependent epimerase/dehydratase family protein [bacterium]|nr:NAD-dependent epimerase/dehydratase family protein [bacterium]
MKKVLITGATGFIGSNLAKKLLSLHSYSVRIFVRPDSNLTRIQGIKQKLDIFTGDLCKKEDILKSLKGVDMLIHLASILKRGWHQDYEKYNIQVSRDLFQQAAKQKLQKIIYLSSLAVMKGTRSPYIYTESDPVSPKTLYGRSKIEVEKIAQDLVRRQKANIIILRPPAVYGEEDNFDRGFIRLIDMIARNSFIPFHDMKNFMSLIYIGNLMDAILTCMKNRKADQKTYFVADREIFTTRELYRLVIRLTAGREKKWRAPTFSVKILEALLENTARVFGYLPNFPEDFVDDMICNYMCSSNKIQSELGWKPPFTLQEGFTRTVYWYQQTRK